MDDLLTVLIPLWVGYFLDLLLGDPRNFPHPVRWFGWCISKGEQLLNQRRFRLVKGAFLAISLIIVTFLIFFQAEYWLYQLHPVLALVFNSVFVFFGLANKSLLQEGKEVFDTLEKQGLDAGRKRLSWIVGRETDKLSPKQIRIAVFESLSENLSDGVIAPLFFYLLGGVPALMAFKMISTMDSMLGYRNERFELFGKVAARTDDLANFFPARITATLMILVSWQKRGLVFVKKYARLHKSPNAGYPEAALAGILDCQFGGPNYYHGQLVPKPFIGTNDREISHQEIKKVARINHGTTLAMMVLISVAMGLVV
ncbi:adenosylcobinamide-phosphate synthase CbiB [Flammeovirgaceae bacterium SG7u.111]|nr:adenosylcobinamide-phosphate synthase CbiB [Flammeovirgaceae bacterium SG7u.132]WPO37093.1 adenosylcobinamide-phosphate synthase CbiB [Flammeovirgaceae bacterium SG7u.111]